MADARAGQDSLAEQAWLQGVQEDPTYAPCYVHAGDYYLAHQRPRQAALGYTAATQLQPDDGALWRLLAQARQQDNDFAGATDAARRATQLMPDSAAAFLLYGQLQEQQNHISEAVAALRRAHTLAPEDRTTAMELARTEITEHQMGRAAQDFLPYLESHLQDPEACYLMAGYYNEQPHTPDNLRQALDYARRAQAAAPANPDAAVLRGRIELALDHPADALPAFLAARRLAPHSERVLQGLVQCDALLNRPVQARQDAGALGVVTQRHVQIEHLQDVLRFNPSDVDADLRLAALEEGDGDRGEAQEFFIQAVRHAPQDARARAALAAFYRRTGDLALARQAQMPSFMP